MVSREVLSTTGRVALFLIENNVPLSMRGKLPSNWGVMLTGDEELRLVEQATDCGPQGK